MATVRLRLGPADHGRAMTLDEFLDAEDTPGYRYELARGVLEVTEVPRDSHGEILHHLHVEFVLYDRAHPGVIRWIGHGSDIRLRIPEMASDRHPDLGIVFRGTPCDERNRRRPRLVVEVLSPGHAAHHRDYVSKREEYLAYGLQEYWIVDPLACRVTVLARHEGDDGPRWSERVFEGGEVIESAMLPGFEGTVSELWAGVEDEDAP